MTTPACARLFEVEALRDGRLAGSERASFERHLANCAACAREADALDTLGQALRSSSLADVDELQVRRERTRLLATFDRNLVGPQGLSPGRGLLVALSVAVLLLVGWFVPWGVDRSERATASDIVIEGDTSARWSRHTRGDRERVVLEQGSLRIRVRPGAPRLVVVLPDGELEDIGTTFSVTVTGGSTKRVQVDEGSVLLKLRGRAPRELRAGQNWQAPPASTPRPERSPDGSIEPSASAAPVHPEPSRARTPAPAANPARASVASDSLPQPASREASAAFRTALANFNAGDPAGAAQQFRRFAEMYPTDPRAEDAAYLRVLAFERAGDSAGRRAAARAYLQRYPTGFRREEVELLAH